MQLSVNTHDYDGKLTSIPSVAINEADLFQLQFRLRNAHALRALQLLLTDRSHNYDPSNRLHALELLTLILQSDKVTECFPLLEEQLADIVLSGPCAQGRCARLYQLYVAVKQNE